MSSMPISAITVGDTVTSGWGTGEVKEHLVTEVTENYNEYGYSITVTCEDGYRLTDVPGGFWYEVRRSDPESEASSRRAAEAYARAWDRRR